MHCTLLEKRGVDKEKYLSDVSEDVKLLIYYVVDVWYQKG